VHPIGNPQTRNRYAYVLNNPASWTDASGLAAYCPYGVNNNTSPPSCNPPPVTFTFFDLCGTLMATNPQGALPPGCAGVPIFISNAYGTAGGSNSGTASNGFNAIAAFFGYDPNDSRPSCFGTFLADVGSGMSRFPTSANPADNISDIADTAGKVGEAYYFNQALNYAAHKPSATFKTPFLAYANKSAVFRQLLQKSGIAAKVGGKLSFWGSLLYSEGTALLNEIRSIRAATCQ
jgi:hypothetical protein